MKLQIVLFVLAAITLCSSSEKIKGRLSNIINEQLLRNEGDNPSKGRYFFHKKGGQSSSTPNIYLLAFPTGDPGYYPDYNDNEEVEEVEGEFDVTIEDAADTRADFDDYFLDSEDEVDNEHQTSRNKNRNSNLKLKRVSGKKQVHRFDVPSSSKKGGNRIQMLRLNGNNNANRNSENIAVLRRLLIQQ